MSGYVLPRPEHERRIVRTWSAGDQRGFEALYEMYAPPLRAFCAMRLSDPYEAEDACHETLLRASHAIDRFRTGKRLWPWLSTIAANVCRDIIESKERTCRSPVESDRIGDPESEAFLNIRTEISRKALNQLPRDFRTLLLLSEFDGWSNKQIAKSFGLSIPAVKNKLLRARRSLQRQVRIVAKKWGQWPLPVFAPLSTLREQRDPERRSFLKRQFDKLDPRNTAAIRAIGVGGMGPDSIGNFLMATSAAGLLAISLLFYAPPPHFPASNTPATSAGAEPPRLARDDGMMLPEGARRIRAEISSKDLHSEVPPSDARTDIGWRRDKDERGSVNAKIVARLEGTPGADLGGNQLVWFYCDSDRISTATCDTVDSLP